MLQRSLWMSALILAAVTGCATTPANVRTVLDDGYNSVRLETRPDVSGQPMALGFDHPAPFQPEEMSRILQSVQIVQPPGFLSRALLKAKAEPEPAFTAEEAEFLAKPLTAALGMAGPEERVVFFLHHQRSIYKGTTTSGVAFVKNRQLNLILGRYRLGNQPGRPDISVQGSPFPQTNDQDFYLAAGAFQTLMDGKVAPGGDESVHPQRWISIDYAPLLAAPPKASTPAASEATSTSPPAKAEPAQTLEEKLRTLNRLKEEGLITEEEYNEKKKELLKSF